MKNTYRFRWGDGGAGSAGGIAASEHEQCDPAESSPEKKKTSTTVPIIDASMWWKRVLVMDVLRTKSAGWDIASYM